MPNPRQMFAEDSFAAPPPPSGRAGLGDTARDTLRRFQAGASVEQIAAQRQLTAGTIYGHLTEAAQMGEAIDLSRFFTVAELCEVAGAFNRPTDAGGLTGVFEALGGRYDYHRLRIFRAAMKLQRGVAPD